jgi:SAM-dependent methyltransferase
MDNASSLFTEYSGIFCCPACGADIDIAAEAIVCGGCRARFPVESGIPLLFAAQKDQHNVTEVVKSFYEENPFPNYDDMDSREALAQKASRGLFAHLVDEQIPANALILEAGCGTGQFSNFLGMSWKHRVFGTDMCLNSLKLANGFRQRYSIHNAAFLQMNLFRPPFRSQSFDVVISNGVLHHTADPLGAFQSIAPLVKPGGYILIGLYNTIGRLTTDLRRQIFKVGGDWLRFLDGHMRNPTYNEARKRAWFMDQYKHPHESKHSYDEVLEWFEGNGTEFLSSIPKIGPEPFGSNEQLFVPHSKGTKFSRWMTQMGMLFSGGKDGALFIMIGRKG